MLTSIAKCTESYLSVVINMMLICCLQKLNQQDQDNKFSYCMIDMDQTDYPVLMIHVCFMNKQSSHEYFGPRRDWRSGLSIKRQANLYHNCNKNNVFSCGPYIARIHRLIYYDA